MMSINRALHDWGVEMARKGGVPADRVVNAIGLQEFTSWLK